MDIDRNGSRPSRKQPPENFTGNVRSDPAFQVGDPVRIRGATVTFEQGGRTNWHTHTVGQTLIILSGCGWVQSWGKPRQTIHPGDVVRFEAGEKHWHGATDTTAMSHLAIVEHDKNGKSSDWLERVTDEQYKSG